MTTMNASIPLYALSPHSCPSPAARARSANSAASIGSSVLDGQKSPSHRTASHDAREARRCPAPAARFRSSSSLRQPNHHRRYRIQDPNRQLDFINICTVARASDDMACFSFEGHGARLGENHPATCGSIRPSTTRARYDDEISRMRSPHSRVVRRQGGSRSVWLRSSTGRQVSR